MHFICWIFTVESEERSGPKSVKMLRTFFAFVLLFSAVFSVINGTCTSPTSYNCDCELRYVCSDSATTHSAVPNGNTFPILTKLTGRPLVRTRGVYLAGSRQAKNAANQVHYCNRLCAGRAHAILGIHATNNADNRIGYNHLAKILDDRNAAETEGKCCGVFIASKRGWCSGNNEWHYVKVVQDFEYYKETVPSTASGTSFDFFVTNTCGTGIPFANGIQEGSVVVVS